MSYVLGRSARELDRLELQGLLYRGITERAFHEAGLAEGMRVLDIGCGSGDVSRVAARLVGMEGAVLGIDRDPDAIARARARAEADGMAQVEHRVAELGEDLNEDPFDALVGRFILMHQNDPGAVLSSCAAMVRPNGVVAMIESNMSTLLEGPHSMPFSGLYDEMVRWKSSVVRSAGADLDAGLRLVDTFAKAGLPRPSVRLQAEVEGGPDSLLYRYMAESCRSMLPAAVEHGVPGFREVEIDGLEDRLRREAQAPGSGFVLWPVVSAWCRTSHS